MFYSADWIGFPREPIFSSVKAEQVPYGQQPTPRDGTFSIGDSRIYLNTTHTPVTIVYRDGMRIRVNPTPVRTDEDISDERARIQYSMHLPQHEKDRLIRSLPDYTDASLGYIYIIQQYHVGQKGIGHIRKWLEWLEQQKDLTSFQLDASGRRMQLANTPTMRYWYSIIMSYYERHPNGSFSEAFSNDSSLLNDKDEYYANYLTLAELDRRSPFTDLNTPSNYKPGISYRFVKMPIVYRVSLREILESNVNGVSESILEERSDIVISAKRMEEAPFHPSDMNIHPGHLGQNQTEIKAAYMAKRMHLKYVEENASAAEYRFVVSKGRMETVPDPLYVSSFLEKEGIRRLKPVLVDEHYPEEGVYVFGLVYNEKSGIHEERQLRVALDDEVALNSIGVFSNRTAARSFNQHQVKAELVEKTITMESKLHAQEQKAEAERMKAEKELKELEKEERKEQAERKRKNSLSFKISSWIDKAIDWLKQGHNLLYAVSTVLGTAVALYASWGKAKEMFGPLFKAVKAAA